MIERTDFETLNRPKSPNTYLLAPGELCRQAEPDAISPVFSTAPGALFDAIARLIRTHGRWHMETCDETHRYIDVVATTKVMKFKDDIALHVLPAGNEQEKSQLAVYSRSRVGYHDMGANRKRVELLIRELNQYR